MWVFQFAKRDGWVLRRKCSNVEGDDDVEGSGCVEVEVLASLLSLR